MDMDNKQVQRQMPAQLKKAKLVLGKYGTVRELSVKIGEYELELQLPELQVPKERRTFDPVLMHNAIMGSGATLFLVGVWLLQRH